VSYAARSQLFCTLWLSCPPYICPSPIPTCGDCPASILWHSDGWCEPSFNTIASGSKVDGPPTFWLFTALDLTLTLTRWPWYTNSRTFVERQPRSRYANEAINASYHLVRNVYSHIKVNFLGQVFRRLSCNETDKQTDRAVGGQWATLNILYKQQQQQQLTDSRRKKGVAGIKQVSLLGRSRRVDKSSATAGIARVFLVNSDQGGCPSLNPVSARYGTLPKVNSCLVPKRPTIRFRLGYSNVILGTTETLKHQCVVTVVCVSWTV